jgi:hypothetical protein
MDHLPDDVILIIFKLKVSIDFLLTCTKFYALRLNIELWKELVVTTFHMDYIRYVNNINKKNEESEQTKQLININASFLEFLKKAHCNSSTDISSLNFELINKPQKDVLKAPLVDEINTDPFKLYKKFLKKRKIS